MSRLIRVSSKDSSQIFHLRASGDDEIYTSPLDNIRRLLILIKDKEDWKIEGRDKPYQVVFDIHVNLPSDFEKLRCSYLNDLRNGESLLPSLLNSLSLSKAKQLYLMISSICTLIQTRLRDVEVFSELPISNNYQELCSYCLSLPKERIQRLLENPREEINQNKASYLKVLTGEAYGYGNHLQGIVLNSIGKKLGIDEPPRIKANEAMEFLLEYKEVL